MTYIAYDYETGKLLDMTQTDGTTPVVVDLDVKLTTGEDLDNFGRQAADRLNRFIARLLADRVGR